MSRTGPEYVTTAPEMWNDLDRKRREGEISEAEAEAFTRLYEFADELGDSVTVGGAKNANFQLKVDAHQGDSTGNPSVFTVNVAGKLKAWPARSPTTGNRDATLVRWKRSDYDEYEREFRTVPGVTDGTEAPFRRVVSAGGLNRFEEVVERFVETCRDCVATAER